MKIHKGDMVLVTTGKDKGKTGKVLRAFPALEQVIVENVNMQKRHEKARGNTKQGGGIVSVSAPVHVSNVALLDPKTNKATRVGVRYDEAKKKNVRYAKKSATVIK
jgi:large subunit ribosomal protein L24